MKKVVMCVVALVLVSVTVMAAQRPVSTVVWDNPTTNDDGSPIAPNSITSIDIKCGANTITLSDPTQLQPGQSGQAPLAIVCQNAVDGQLTIVAKVTNQQGFSSDFSAPSQPFQKAADSFFLIGVGPDAPSSLRLQ